MPGLLRLSFFDVNGEQPYYFLKGLVNDFLLWYPVRYRSVPSSFIAVSHVAQLARSLAEVEKTHLGVEQVGRSEPCSAPS